VAPTAPVEVAAKEKSDRPRKVAKAAAKAGKTHPCVVCGKPFVRRTSEKTCSTECRNKRTAASQAKWQKKSAARPAVAEVPSAATALPHKCQDCGDDLDNPKKLVCNACASLRLRDASRG
jgi:predicted  nucleic acid-binding Zn-ribbon protein